MLKLEDGETIQTIINARKEETAGKSFFFTTKQGVVKRTEVSEFNNIRQNGLRALNLKEGDQLINVLLTNGQDDIIIGTQSGYSVRFNEASIRNMGRSATGVRGVSLREDDRVVGASRINDHQEVLVITENGYGKRTEATEYPTKGRGVKGLRQLTSLLKTGNWLDL